MTYLYCYDSMLTKKTQRGVQDDGSRKDQKLTKAAAQYNPADMSDRGLTQREKFTILYISIVKNK